MRNVLAKIWDAEKKEWTPVFGKFHCWGQGYEEFESGPGNFTMGIIELENGKIVTTIPENITFVSKEENQNR